MHCGTRTGGLFLFGATMLLLARLPGCAAGDRRTHADEEAVALAITQRMAADRALQRGRYGEAIKAYVAIIGKVPKDGAGLAALHFKLARAYWGRSKQVDGKGPDESAIADRKAATDSDRAAALRHGREAMTLMGPSGAERDPKGHAMIARTLASYHRGLGEYDEAIQIYQQLMQDDDPQGEGATTALVDLGNTYLDRFQRTSANDAGVSVDADDLSLAERTLGLALEAVDRFGHDSPELRVEVLNSLGLIHNLRFQPAAAEERFAEAARICRDYELAMWRPSVLQNLGLARIELARLDDAKKVCDELEALPAAAGDPRTMAALGFLYLKLGDLPLARQRFDLARFMMSDVGVGRYDSTLVAELASNAATAAQAVGEYDEAERLLTEAIDELASGAVDPRMAAVVQANLGRMYLTLERLDAADAQLHAAYESLKRIQGPQHPDSLLLRLDLANLARTRGHKTEATEECEAALRGLAVVRGRDDPTVATARLELAALYRDQGRCKEALTQAEQATATLDEKLGLDHQRCVLAFLTRTLISADCSAVMDGASSLEELLKEAGRRFAGLRRRLGRDNVQVLQATVEFAEISAKTEAAYKSALARYDEAEEGYLRIYGDAAISLAALRLKKGRLLERMERYDDAMSTFERAMRSLDRTLRSHPVYAELLGSVGDVHALRGETETASGRWGEALRILRNTYGADHPRVQQFISEHRP